jgi:hypothetical protein
VSGDLNIAPEDIEVIIDWPELAIKGVTIREEIEDPRFLSKRHGTRVAYNAGCRGALCRKANRDNMRKYLKGSSPSDRPTRVSRFDKYNEVLDAIIAWHHAKYVQIRKEREEIEKAS